jgi:hypothetical protein
MGEAAVKLSGLDRVTDLLINEMRGKEINAGAHIRERWSELRPMLSGEELDYLAQTSLMQRVGPYLRNPMHREDSAASVPRPNTTSLMIRKQPESEPAPQRTIRIEFRTLEQSSYTTPSGERKPLILFHTSEWDWIVERLQNVSDGCIRTKKVFAYISARLKTLGKTRVSDLAHGEKSKIEDMLLGLKGKGILAERWLE